jgi:hypothetical protein
MSLKKPSDTYNPLYFLASVGAGGLSVTFFMYLMFWVPHKGRPVPVFEDIMNAFNGGNPALQFAIIAAMVGIAFFAFTNLKMLFWNLANFAKFKKTDGYNALMNSNAEASTLAMPLAIAMSINGMFIVGLVFVPQLWTIVEYLFPAAMVAFFLNGIFAMKMIGNMLARYFATENGFNAEMNNNFSQALPAFALSMNAVGLAAPATMSHNETVVGLSLILSTFFGLSAVIYAIVAMAAAMPSILKQGVAREAAPTLMIGVPLITILSIMIMRQNHGIHVAFDGHSAPIDTLMFLAKGITLQIVLLALGLAVLNRQGYFKDFVLGDKTSPASYALICPGVAFSVLGHFFINKGLVANHIIDKFGPAYWGLTAIAIASQFLMVWTVLRLNRQHFGKVTQAVVPAE